MLINNTQFNCSLEEVVAELRQQLHINGIRLLEKEPRDSGNDLQIQCPYHHGGQERKPSAGIRKSDGQFHCFACGETHSLSEVISHCFGYTDDIMGSWGWQWLLKNFLTVSIEERRDVKLDFNRNNNVDNRNNNSTSYVSEEELDSYRYIHPYLKERGIVNEVIIELFDIGYDRDSDCITFPVRDIRGGTLFIARRSVNSKYFNYPSGAEKPLYGLYEISKFWKGEYRVDEIPEEDIKPWISGGRVFVCESMIDCILLWQVGYYAVALNGLGNELQFKQLRDLPCRELILATDMDEAGMKARDRIKKNVSNKIIKQVFLPEGRKDIGECTKEELVDLKSVF